VAIMRIIENSSIYAKSLIAPSILVLATVVITLISIFSMANQRLFFEENTAASLNKIALLDDFILTSQKIKSDLFQISVLRLMGTSQAETRTIKERLEQLVADLNIIYKRILTTWKLDSHEQSILKKLKKPMADLARHTSDAVEIVSLNPALGAVLARSSLETFDRFHIELTSFLDHQKNKIALAQQESAQNTKKAASLIISILAFITVMGVIITLFVSKYFISHPIQYLTRSMLKLASGDYSEKIKTGISSEEIGQMSRAVEVFRRNAIEKDALEKKLRQSQKLEAIGNLAGGIAHDFNNILASIIGFTELVLEEVEKGSNTEDSLQEVYIAAKRARDLVKQILAFARQSSEEIKPVQVAPIAKEVLKFIRSSTPSTIEIRQKIQSNSFIMGNSTQIHQVLMNLCTNAAYSMENQGGILSVELQDVSINPENVHQNMDLKVGSYVELKVSDTGSGIPPEIIDSIFEPYFTTKGPGEGTGMGLALVHGIAESYGGKITVDSQINKGTSFILYLPIKKTARSQSHYRPEILPSGTERILFVDDEEPITKMGSRNLESLGYSVTSRTSSVEALALFRSKPNDFDLVISDMTMPSMTGDKLATELMNIRSNIPIIICTGYSKKISEDSAAEIGIKAFAYKPIVKVDLAKTVRKVLDEAKR
jgi:signal transduction histidine kinase/CheY-like chemotaxis protein